MVGFKPSLGDSHVKQGLRTTDRAPFSLNCMFKETKDEMLCIEFLSRLYILICELGPLL